jgi:hypothetical protein
MESHAASAPAGALTFPAVESPGALPGAEAPLGPTLALSAALATGALLLGIAVVFAVVHPEHYLVVFSSIGIPEQHQGAKTAMYVLSVAVVAPATAILVPRLADRIARGPAASALSPLAAVITGGLGLAVILVRLSGGLPWGDGLWVLAAALAAWAGASGLLLAGAAGGSAHFRRLTVIGGHPVALWTVAATSVLIAVLCATKRASLHAVPALACAAVAALIVVLYARMPHRRGTPRLGERRAPLRVLDGVFPLVLVLAIVPTVVVGPTLGLPNIFFPPGIVQYHQDFLLGPANQLLRGGGALLVNVPISQYGVGTIYFLDAVFHLIPIGYGTYGLIDGVLTGLFYAAGYLVLRAAGVRRLLAAGAVSVGCVALLYTLRYPVGQLPQQGALRFGLPMAVIFGSTVAERWPRRTALGRTLAVAALGVSSIWALEGFVYSLATFAAATVVAASLHPSRTRRAWAVRQVALALGACAFFHAVLAAWTLAATGHLPDWGQYLVYLREFLLGGGPSKDTYGFERWSPGLAVALGTLAAAVALPVLVRRERALAARYAPAAVALGGLTGFAVVLMSYTDNRSSTYLLGYITLPLLMTATLWLSLLLRSVRASLAARTGALSFGLALAAALLAVAWPQIGGHFSRSVLAKAYPGSSLSAAVHRLVHLPPVDPRATAGQRLLARYMPGRKVIMLVPDAPDLATETLMRADRANLLFTGDPKADSYVPAVWTATVGRQIATLPPGTRVLVDRAALRVLAVLRTHPHIDLFTHPVLLGSPQQEWVLDRLQRRFILRPVASDAPSGLIVEQLSGKPPAAG